ncbi:hypothetical protein [Alicyclobacillus tolerans]|uniref:Copper amine oxidase N-terminal domain-containing protein n=1 Tax=Alicyclobacillus tolerans TaxID=90970 RepID=A0A1M6N2V8_9BACL|nr:hypothetical protein [Alicyclobacillus montanus]SHJ90051.1 hypothetical protein SAMN05443507_10562 [Alicyclobacillus montanus]
MRIVRSLCTAALLMTFCPTVVLASTQTSHHLEGSQEFVTTIRINGKGMDRPYGRVYQNTTFIPIWYVMQALNSFQYQSQWNGKQWEITAPSVSSSSLSRIGGKGNMTIFLNGQKVAQVPSFVAPDPLTKKATTYAPIWYIMQILKQAGVISIWKDHIWSMQTVTPSKQTSPTLSLPPVLPSNEVAAGSFVLQFLTEEGELPPHSTPLQAMSFAIQNGWWDTNSTQHTEYLGAYEPLTVEEAEQLDWNFLGMSNPAFQPGGSMSAWAQFIGLNPAGLSLTADVTPTEADAMLHVIADDSQGYQALKEHQWQIVYPPENEAMATFQGDMTANGQPFFTSNQAVQQVIQDTYQFFDGIQVQASSNGKQWIVTLPNVSAAGEFYIASSNNANYSVNGGQTWQTVNRLNSLRLNEHSSVQIQLPDTSALSLSYNVLLPNLGGSTTLGEMTLRLNSAEQLQVHRDQLD